MRRLEHFQELIDATFRRDNLRSERVCLADFSNRFACRELDAAIIAAKKAHGDVDATLPFNRCPHRIPRIGRRRKRHDHVLVCRLLRNEAQHLINELRHRVHNHSRVLAAHERCAC